MDIYCKKVVPPHYSGHRRQLSPLLDARSRLDAARTGTAHRQMTSPRVLRPKQCTAAATNATQTLLNLNAFQFYIENVSI